MRVWLSGRTHIDERRTIVRRAAASEKAKKTKTKHNKTNVTSGKDNTISIRRIQVLMHPRQREGLKSLEEDDIELVVLIE